MIDEEKVSDIYDICLEKKSIYCNRKMGEETCSKCKTYKMYKLGLAEVRKEGYEQGMKKVCKICEQNMLEEHPNACGCAFRRLSNEYCWEFE